MLNNVVFVGRLTADPEVTTTKNGKEVSNITLAVPRSYKNAEGNYDTDFVDVTLWDKMAGATAEYCKKGAIVGIKGRVETDNYETEAGEKRKATKIIAEKVTFLSPAKEKEADKEASDEFEI